MAQPTDTTHAAPHLEDGRPLLIAGLKAQVMPDTMMAVPGQWRRFSSFLGTMPAQVGTTTYGLGFENDDGLDYLCGVEVSNLADLPAELCSVTIPAQRYLVFAHVGHVSKIWQTVRWIWRSGIREAGCVPEHATGSPDFLERYGADFDPARGTGGIDICVPVRIH